MNNPTSTYRIQFHNEFTFSDFERIIPYLAKLGIKTIYASPIFEAMPGSQHGYDVVNSQRLNPEIGTEKQLRAISQQLTELQISWLQDIVPNHMAYHPRNPWLMDVLEKGQLSPYASFFDIDWNSPHHHGRLMVPFLGTPLDEAIDAGELRVAYESDRFVFTYQNTLYPLHLRSYASILQADKRIDTSLVQPLLDQINKLGKVTDTSDYAQDHAEFLETLTRRMKEKPVNDYVEKELTAVNASPDCLRDIADEQVYRLCQFSETDTQINYRRFFTVNSLICLNIQNRDVFDAVHQLPKALFEAGIFHGMRVDHIDGLYDPVRYLEHLRKLAGEEAYIVVEKILQNNEELPSDWPIQGATGYAYLSMVNNLFTRTKSQQVFTQFYRELLGEKQAVHQELQDKKAYILHQHMRGELDNLYHLFLELRLIDKNRLDKLSRGLLKSSIGEFLIQCPVYRFYGNQMPLGQSESEAVNAIFDRIRAQKPNLTPAVDLLAEAILTKPQEGNDDYQERALRFYQRCMQFTGPLTAKGVEDTLMYTYNRFIGHDEVGDSPEYFGMTTDEFHQKMLDRQANWPLALNATSTHDTKRGEDVRSRLNVLTDLADEWIEEVRAWQQLNRSANENGPDSNDEYFIYQTLVGAYPMPGSEEEADFPDRLDEYLLKALREAKRFSTHDAPNEAYEEATMAFARTLLDKRRSFWHRFEPFFRRIADLGIINSLAQVVLKCSCPGLPDVYQGSELWNLSLVDPDNRRPVDFEQRQRWLDELMGESTPDLVAKLWQHRYDGRIKLWLIHTLLTERNQQMGLFTSGQYVPLEVEGAFKQHVLAFARQLEQLWYVVVVPLGPAQLCRDQQTDVLTLNWEDTRIILPGDAPGSWENRLDKASGTTKNGLKVGELFRSLPLAVLKLE
ncbi:malto-oligosyltrehalose synthase [Spirosoma sp. KNUC1025]|uniref:malto-oligosyltrehalose synthase n=1 Tax=Spirosoma sp. KNUC1025 TaxID=2894082 RepID=UPI003867F49A|nr:malto-oligosyltrehalose synthase [Spirosoma sp. KNUC1025]